MAKIVIKIKDEFFLQKATYTANVSKLVIGSNFPFQTDPNTSSAKNFDNIANIYSTMKNIGNQGDSIGVFQKLLNNVSPLAKNGKIESLFSVVDSTEPINLMYMALDELKADGIKFDKNSIGENLLNYYFIEVDNKIVIQTLETINKIKQNITNSGIDYFYLRGTITNFMQSKSSSSPIDLGTLDAVNFQAKAVNKSVIRNFKLNSFTTPAKVPESRPQNQSVAEINTVSTPPTPLIIQNINKIFNNCGITIGTNLSSSTASKPTIKIVDLEQGWKFDLPITYSGSGLNSNTVLGGGVNDLTPSFQLHGQKTLNVLLGQETPDATNTLNGLSKGANVRVGSVLYSAGEYKEAALASILGYGYNKAKDEISGTSTKYINKYDIVLLELQVELSYKIYPEPVKTESVPFPNKYGLALFPVEIEPAMWNVIDKGVKAKYIIIEAAGNGNNNLDVIPHPASNTELKDISSKTKGTGAIMVGALNNLGSQKLNYGSRVDYRCFGDDVDTSATISALSDKPFNSTSLASAITAALVANFQSMALKNTANGGIGRRLTISEIKFMLNNIPNSPPSSFGTFLNNLHTANGNKGFKPSSLLLP